MNWGLLTIYIMSGISALAIAHLHGKKRDPYNFWIETLSTIVKLVLIWWALDWRFI